MKRPTVSRLEQQIAELAARPPKNKSATPLGAGLYVVTYPSGKQSFARMERNANGHNQARAFAPVKVNASDPTPGALRLIEAQAWIATHAIASEASQARELELATLDKSTLTFAELIAQFLDKKIDPRNDMNADRKRRYRNTLENTFCKSTVPDLGGQWGKLKVGAFTGGVWIDRYETTLFKIERESIATGSRRGKSTLGHEVDQFMQKVFDYAIRRGVLLPEHRPERNKDVRRPKAITRHLSVAEIERLFTATTPQAVTKAEAMNELDACFMRVLMLTGIRLNSVRLARRSNMHVHAKDFWTFPSDDLKETKAQREAPADHHIPLTDLLQRELARLEESLPAECDPFFPERYHRKRDYDAKPRSQSWAKHLLAEFATTLGNTKQPYTAHAFRRTQSNVMRELGVPDHVIDLCQARVPRDTAKTYLTAELRDQVQNAFDLYHDFLEACMQAKGEEYLQAVRDRRRADYVKERVAIRKHIGMQSVSVIRGKRA
jgi:integrase